MALNNDSIIQAAVGIWSGNSAITLPEALSLMIANTSLDKSDAHIENFLGELLNGVSDLAKSTDEFEAAFGAGADLGNVDFVLVNAVRDLTTEKSARVETKKFSETLADNEVVVSSEDGLVFRFCHIDFWANENGTEDDAYVVPSSLMIRRSHLNKKIESVRSTSSPVAIAPDPIEAISVDLIFPNVKCLNKRFRDIYSMTQMLPVFTIDSPLITKAFINETDFPETYNRAVAEIINNDAKIQKDIKGVQNEALSSLNNAIELSRTDDPFIDHIIDRIAIEAENSIIGPEENLPTTETLVNRVSTAVGVALKSITLQSLPGQPGAVMARLSFTRANIPMLEKGQPLYLDVNGRPTHSPQNATWLKKFSRTLMNKTIAKDRFLEPIDANEPGWDDFELTWENIFGEEKTVSLNSEISTETQFNFISGFKIVPLNILNSSSPLIQHMGRNNLEGVLVLETTDQEFVASLSAAKAEIAQEAKNGYVRRNSALIKHPVVNMLGVKRVSIKDIAIQESQDNPGLISVTLGLIENALNVEDVESLTIEQGTLDFRAIEILWDFARRLSDYEYELKKQAANLGMQLFNYQSWLKQLDDAESYTREFIRKMVYGIEGGRAGIFRMPRGNTTWIPNYSAVSAGIVRLYKQITGDYKAEDVTPLVRDVAQMVTEWMFRPGPTKKVLNVDDKTGKIYEAIGYTVEKNILYDAGVLVLAGDSSFTMGHFPDFTTVDDTTNYTVRQQPIPRALWDSILEATIKAEGDKSGAGAWKAKDLKAAMAVLSGLVTSGVVENIVSIPKFDPFHSANAARSGYGKIDWKYRDYLKAKESPENLARRNKAATNYADMVLPTYEELFNGAYDSEYEPVWKKFAPTYSDLGTKPPLNNKTAFLSISDAFNACAHTEFDLVSPGSFFYKPRVKNHIHDAAQELHDESFDQADYAEVIRVPINYDAILDKLGVDNFAGADNNAIEEIVLSGLGKGPMGSGIWSEESEKFKDFKKDENVRVIDIVDNEGRPILNVTKDVDGKTRATVSIGKRNIFTATPGDPAFDTQSKKDADKMFHSSVEHTPDNTSNTDKSFPAIRIYLVEEDRRYRALFDDLYAVSAIESVSVTRDHMDADTAVIKLANTTGYLSEDSFIPKRVNDEKDDDGEPLLNRFKVAYGTHIVVKMGYASRPEDLKTVFTGAVAEIMGGDSITLIAQSFQTELLNDVGVFQEYWTWDLADRPHLRNVLNKVLKKNGDAPHLGRNIVLDDPHSKEATELIDDLYGTYSGVATKWYRNPLRYAAEAFGGAVHSDIARNVYMDSNTSFSSEFVIPTMPTMDAIRECAKYHPNFIADVVPYGVDGTLFVGDPGSQYKYREISVKEKDLFELAAAEEQKDLFTLGGAFGDMMNGFMSSSNFDDYKATLARAEEEIGVNTDLDEIGFDNMFGLRSFFGGDHDELGVTDFTRDIISGIKGQEKNIDGLHRRAFCFFYGLNPNTTNWPRGVRAGWRDASEALLSPWYNYAEDEATPSFRNAVAYLNSGANQQTRLTISSEEVSFGRKVRSSLNVLKSASDAFTDANQVKFRTVYGFDEQTPNALRNFANTSTDPDLEQVVLPGSGAERLMTGDTEEGSYIVDHLYQSALEYRIFMLHLAEYLEANQITDTSEMQKSRVFAAEIPPGYKSFRDYHLVTSEQDIIENNITASDSEMWTAVAIKAPAVVEVEGFFSGVMGIFDLAKGIDDPLEYGDLVVLSPDQEYTLWPEEATVPGEGNRAGVTFKGQSPKAEDILKIFHEPNAVSPFAASVVVNSRLCEGMSKMYRGNIIIVGKAIKPHDIVHIRDAKNNIMGNVVAERVTHNFDPNFGWTTTIVPKAATYHNSNFSYEVAGFWSDLWNVATSDEINDLMLFVTLASAAASVIATGGLGFPAAAAAFLTTLSGQARANVAKAAGTTGTKALVVSGTKTAAANLSTKLVGAKPITWLANRTGRASAAYLGHTVLQAGDRSVGRVIRAMTESALAQNIGGDKYPVLVNTLVYQGRPYTAGFKPNEGDFNGPFWDQFSTMMKDLGGAIVDAFESNRKIDADGTLSDIIRSD